MRYECAAMCAICWIWPSSSLRAACSLNHITASIPDRGEGHLPPPHPPPLPRSMILPTRTRRAPPSSASSLPRTFSLSLKPLNLQILILPCSITHTLSSNPSPVDGLSSYQEIQLRPTTLLQLELARICFSTNLFIPFLREHNGSSVHPTGNAAGLLRRYGKKSRQLSHQQTMREEHRRQRRLYTWLSRAISS